jgi:hypothetical protein
LHSTGFRGGIQRASAFAELGGRRHVHNWGIRFSGWPLVSGSRAGSRDWPLRRSRRTIHIIQYAIIDGNPATIHFSNTLIPDHHGDPMIRPSTPDDTDALYFIINDSAIAYKGVIPLDRWHEPYMPMEHLRKEIESGVRFYIYEEDK